MFLCILVANVYDFLAICIFKQHLLEKGGSNFISKDLLHLVPNLILVSPFFSP
jgi:hypothetical protein